MRKLTLMLTAGLLVTAGVVAALGSASGGESSGRATLRLVDRSPITVQGRHFRAHERVRVTLYKEQASVRTRRVTASRRGAFTASLPAGEIDRCDRIVIRAVGAGGSIAQLKLPQPACRGT